MIQCYECGALFEEPDHYSERMGEYQGEPAYQEFPCCPVCGSDDIEENEDDEI